MNSDKTTLLAMVCDNQFENIIYCLSGKEYHADNEYPAFFQMVLKYPSFHMTKKKRDLCLECIHTFIDSGFDIYAEHVLVKSETITVKQEFSSVFKLSKNLHTMFAGGAHNYASWLPDHLQEYQVKSHKKFFSDKFHYKNKNILKRSRL